MNAIRTNPAYLLGIDIGTSGVKTGLWTEDGVLVAEATIEYALHRPEPAWAEQNADDWWGATCNSITQVLMQSGINANEIAAVGVDGLGWVLLPVDEDGNPLHPAMIWLDRRADQEAEWLRTLEEADSLVDMVANPLDAAYITPKLLWLKHHKPDIFEKTCQFLTSSGFIVHHLTGNFSCDYTQAYGYHFFDIREGKWDPEIARRLDIPIDKLPPLYQSCEVVGELTHIAAEATGLVVGTPVIAGGLDAAVGSLGAGVAHVGQTVDQGGQAGGFAMSVNHVIVEPRLIFSHHVLPGQYLFQGGTVSGGSLAWFRDILGQWEVNAAQLLRCSPFTLMNQQVEETPPGSHGLIFLPYMAGERSPIWNSDARGVFFGMSYKTTRGDILRAIMEGAAYAVQHNVHVAETHSVAVKEWIGVGGATRSDVWCQIKADVTNKPFTLARRRGGGEGGHTFGLAIMAASAVGLCDDISDRIDELLPQRKVFEPSVQRHAVYQELFEIYLALSDKLQVNFEQLAHVCRRYPHILSPDS